MVNNSHWSRVAESGTIIGMQILLFCYRVFGRWAFRLCLFPVMTYYYLTRREARKASQDYLSRLTETYPDLGRLSSFKHFLMFADILLDKLLAWMGRIQLKDVRFHSDGQFEAAIEQKQGGIIVVSHLGNTEVCNALAHQQPNLKLTLLVYTQHAEKFNALMKKVGNTTQVKMYQVTDMSPAFAMMMAERVEAGEFLVIAGDRTPVTGQQRVSQVTFLGEQVALPQGAFLLASLLKCPVYLMFCLKQDKMYHIYTELFSEKLSFTRQQRQALLTNTVQQYADRLAHYCHIAPLQWFNFYPFWQKTSAQTQQTEEKQ
ncbi:hypothetical protein [Methylophaga sp.]|uniref:hypothetical protein n=1 Tax=Methylophaga sp. TaxID=2024840 RepID=UPI003A905421